MKNKLALFIGGLALVAFSHAAMAQSTSYTVTANIPPGTGVGITAHSIDATSGAATPVSGTTLTIATAYNTTNNVYLGTNYFTLDVAVQGAGAPQTTVSYTAGSVPNGETLSTLGSNASLAYNKEVYTSSSTPPTQTTISGFPPVVLSSLTTAKTVPYTDVTGGWLRLTLGLCTGGSTDPSGCKPFTAADQAGNYSGTLTVSATVN